MAHKKAGGSSNNGRDSIGRRLGDEEEIPSSCLVGAYFYGNNS